MGRDEKKEADALKKIQGDDTKEVEEEEAPIELTEEEKNQAWFCKSSTPDLSKNVLAKFFTSFSIPTKEEGFDEIRFVWQPEAQASAHLKAWVMENKRTQKAEDLEPSDWFKTKFAEWTKLKDDWTQ